MVNGSYNFSKMLGGNHELHERVNYARIFRNTIREKEDMSDVRNKYIVDIFDRIIDRPDNTMLDVSIYSSYIFDLLGNDPEYKHLQNYTSLNFTDFVNL